MAYTVLARRNGLRRMAKWMALATAALCLLAEIAEVFFVVRWTSAKKDVEVSAMNGHAYVAWLEGNPAFGDLNGMPPGLHLAQRFEVPRLWPPRGSFYGTIRTPKGNTLHGVLVPLWMPTLGAGVLAVLLCRIDSRRAPGACAKCSYNLSGLAPGTSCPECGTSPPAK